MTDEGAQVVRLLLGRLQEHGYLGEAVGHANNLGLTPLLAAADMGAEGAARALLDAGAEVNAAAVGGNGEVALHHAAIQGHAGMVR